MSDQRAIVSQRAALAVGAALTVVAAVAVDLFAGEVPLHAATLGGVTALAAVIRLRLAGPQRGLPQFLCGCIVSQPAIHYAVKLLPHTSLEHGVGNLPGPADLFVATLQTMVIITVVVTLTYFEQTLLALTIRAFRLFILRIRSIRPGPEQVKFAITVAPATELRVGRYHPGSIARRGPPVPSAAF